MNDIVKIWLKGQPILVTQSQCDEMNAHAIEKAGAATHTTEDHAYQYLIDKGIIKTEKKTK